ncbi:MAG TPA: hypothetical protein VFJ22_11860 [Dermatophilaceae bacterium]|nr:hypothetical protein [Dermatophilaceae bacterium]
MRAVQPVVLGLVMVALAGCGTVVAPPGSSTEPPGRQSTTQRAAALDGAGRGAADVPIYLVQMRGRFELSTAPRPPGATSPRGSVLLLFVPNGPSQKYGGGLTLSNKTVDLGVFGPMDAFLPPRAAAQPTPAV